MLQSAQSFPPSITPKKKQEDVQGTHQPAELRMLLRQPLVGENFAVVIKYETERLAGGLTHQLRRTSVCLPRTIAQKYNTCRLLEESQDRIYLQARRRRRRENERNSLLCLRLHPPCDTHSTTSAEEGKKGVIS